MDGIRENVSHSPRGQNQNSPGDTELKPYVKKNARQVQSIFVCEFVQNGGITGVGPL